MTPPTVQFVVCRPEAGIHCDVYDPLPGMRSLAAFTSAPSSILALNSMSAFWPASRPVTVYLMSTVLLHG